ncbi:MAG TPA: MYXO-CTERM sorting domain-containing protein [Polyangiaceae bacterium]|jgi:MYXO-CTERM domain-containing protein
MRFWIVLAFLLVSASARAQDAGDSWSEFQANATALDAPSPDCATACKALESLARAADHICAIAPEHCQEARARVAAARERVRAACPDCAISFQDEYRTGATTEVLAVRSAPSRGGCAGCAMTPSSGSGGALFALGLGLLLARIRRR